jgi:hypothetical protein
MFLAVYSDIECVGIWPFVYGGINMSNQINLNASLELYKSLSATSTQTSQTKDDNTAIQKQTKDNTGVILELGTSLKIGATYTKPTSKGSGADEIEALKAEAEKNTETLRKLVEKLILGQAELSGGISLKGIFSPDGAGSLTIGSDVELTDEEESIIAGASDSLSEDGENGIKAVSDRIVDFAKAISGGDRSKYETLKSAIEEGFTQAKDALGGYLPEISEKTYDAVIEKLDKWYKGENE